MTEIRMICLLFVMLAPTWEPSVLAAAEAVHPPAQEVFERGLVAAEQQQWALAIRYFREAQNAAPTSPAILFNLGLAHGKAGHELPAIAWLQAYLTCTGKPANAEAVRKEILRLEVATEAKIAQVLQQAIATDTTIRAVERYSPREGYCTDTQASIGDIDGAIRAGLQPDRAWEHHAFFLGFARLTEKAELAVARISDVKIRDNVYGNVAEILLTTSSEYAETAPYNLSLNFELFADLSLARAVTMKIVNPTTRAGVLAQVLQKDFRLDDEPLALTCLDQLPASSKLDREFLLGRMIRNAARRQDFETGIRFTERLIALTSDEKMPFSGTINAVRSIPTAQLVRGDGAGARATAKRLLASARGYHRANLEVVLGNYEPARAIMPTLKCTTDEKADLFKWIIFTQAATGNITGAKASTKEAASACAGSTWGTEILYRSQITSTLVRKRDLQRALAHIRDEGGVIPNYDVVLEFVRNAARVDDLIAIEKAAPHLIVDSNLAAFQLVLADAYETRQNAGEAARLRRQAAGFFLRDLRWIQFESAASAVKVVRSLEDSGDSTGARLIAAAAKPDPLVADWIQAAIKLSSDDVATDLPKVLARVGSLKPEDARSSLNKLAKALAGRLFALRGAIVRAAARH